MQSPVGDDYAIAFSAAFYDGIACGLPVDEALTEGRQAIHSLNPAGSDWAIPVLFLRTPTGDLFEHLGHSRTPTAGKEGLAWSAALLLTILLLVSTRELIPWPREAEEPSIALQQVPVERTAAATPPPATPAQEPAPDARKPERQSLPSGSPVSRVVQSGHLRFDIHAAQTPPSTFTSTLRQASDKVADLTGVDLAGWTVRLDLGAPRVESYSEAGLQWQSCRINVSGRLQGQGRSLDLGSLSAVRSKVDREAACEDAATELAESLVRKLAPLLKEGAS